MSTVRKMCKRNRHHTNQPHCQKHSPLSNNFLRLLLYMICLCAMLCIAIGCTSKKEERLQNIDFTVIDDAEIPDELKTIIDQKKTGEFKLTYADQDELYIVVGYGKQLTGGYSIQFPDVYLTKDNIVVTSVLLGPEEEEPANISYPYAVIKIEYRSEPVLFQ